VTEGTLRLAILGAGRMGREVEAIAHARGIEVAVIMDLEEVAQREDALAALREVDVAIEFTEPDAAVGNIQLCLEAGCPIVVGTTGWYQSLDHVCQMVAESGGALLWAPNFSTGVALLRALLDHAGKLLSGIEGFEMHMTETHHAAKKDAPSGTALHLAETLGTSGHEIPITSVRLGQVPGQHTVHIDGAYEQVVLSHEARTRGVFADGAVTAAMWLTGRTGVFTMDDVMGLVQ